MLGELGGHVAAVEQDFVVQLAQFGVQRCNEGGGFVHGLGAGGVRLRLRCVRCGSAVLSHAGADAVGAWEVEGGFCTRREAV